MGESRIEWTDRTWNPVTGCTKVSAGCKNCYAEAIANRFFRNYWTPDGKSSRQFTDVWTHADRLSQPLKWRKPSRVFVNSMSDLFHEDVPFEFIDEVVKVMRETQRHTYQILTKRPRRMLEYFKDRENFNFFHPTGCGCLCHDGDGDANIEGGCKRCDDVHEWPLKNVWAGVSVEDQKTADERIQLLLDTPAVIRFVSYEPALSYVDFSKWMYNPVHEEQAERGFRLSGGAERGLRDSPRRDNLETPEEGLGQVAAEGSQSAMQASSSGTRLRGVFSSEDHARRDQGLRSSSSTGIQTSEGSDTGGPDDQSRRRKKETKSPGQPHSGDTFRTSSSRDSSARQESESTESIWRRQRDGQTHSLPGVGNQETQRNRGETESNSGGLWDYLPSSVENSERRSLGLHLVIVGGESGPKARPFNIQWARDVIAQCRAAKVACFVKQMGSNLGNLGPRFDYSGRVHFKDSKGGDMSEWPEDLRVREFPA